MMFRPCTPALVAALLLIACNASRSGQDHGGADVSDASLVDVGGGDAMADAIDDAIAPMPNTPWPEGEVALEVLFPEDIRPFDRVGQSVDMGRRANGTLVIAVGDDAPAGEFNFVGQVTIFTQEPGALEWQRETTLRPSNPSQQLRMAKSVAYENDTVVAGAVGGPGEPGRVYVFERLNGEWVQTQQIDAPGMSDVAMANFGALVDLSGDRLAIGASSPGTLEDDDVVTIYERPNGVWEPVAAIRSPEERDEALFGNVFSLDGDRIAIGDEINGDNVAAGLVHIFDRNDSGAWLHSATLAPPEPEDYESMGRALALRGDVLMAGAPGKGGINLPGSVRVFEFDGSAWSQTARLTSSSSELHAEFGSAVAFDPPNVLVGAVLEDNGSRNTGSAYLFGIEDGEWTERVRWTPPTDATSQGFGWRVALAGDTAVIGSVSDDTGANSGGALFVGTRP